MSALPPATPDALAWPGEHPADEVLSLSLEGVDEDWDEDRNRAGAPAGDEPGLLGQAELAAVEAHLASCSRCRDRRHALAAVPELLRAAALAPPPGDPGAGSDTQVPADVASALDRALARAQRGAGAPGAQPAAGAPAAGWAVVPLRPRRPRSTVLLQAAAALAAVGLVGGLAWGAFSSNGSAGPAGSSSASSGGAGAGSSAGAAASKPGEVPVLVPTQLDLSADTLAQGVSSALREPPAPRTPLPLPTGARGAVSTPAAPDGSATFAPSTGALDALLTPDGLRTCAARLSPGQPLTEVLSIRWHGSPAAVLVFPSEGDPEHVDAYAVAPTCPVGEFLGFVRLAR